MVVYIHRSLSTYLIICCQLNGGTLDGATLSVTTDQVHPDEEHHDAAGNTFDQSDKPRAGSMFISRPLQLFFVWQIHLVAAEYLAKGYTLSDHILQRAIELDSKHRLLISLQMSDAYSIGKQGISKRFLNFMQGLDKSVGSRALGPEQTISGRAQATAETAVQHAKAMDEQKGFTKTANDVSCLHLQI